MVIPTLLLTWGFAARPFLPAGQGGLILIAGGLTMISVALLVLNARHRPIPGSVSLEPPRRVAPRSEPRQTARPVQASAVLVAKAPEVRQVPKLARAVVAPDGERMVWPSYIQANAAKHGLRSHIVSVDRTRCLIEVERCRSCRKRKKTCEKERRQLQAAARKLNRRARVAEAACNREGRHVCTFRVDMGGRN